VGGARNLKKIAHVRTKLEWELAGRKWKKRRKSQKANLKIRRQTTDPIKKFQEGRRETKHLRGERRKAQKKIGERKRGKTNVG